MTAGPPWGIIAAVVRIILISITLWAAAANAVDVNVAEDEAKKAEAAMLAPLPGEGYYDAAALEELALEAARRSPTGAMWRSFAVPGWGQFYNGHKIKGCAIIGAEAFFLYHAAVNFVESRRYLRDASAEPTGDRKKELYAANEDAVLDTEFWGWLFVGSIAYSMMDAYVDAHLADWEVKDLPADKETSASPSVRLELGPTGVSLALAF